MKKGFFKVVIGIIAIVIIVVFVLFANNCIGLSTNKLELDIRSSRNIQENWTVDGNVSDSMAAYIAYSGEKGGGSFYVYVNRPGLSFGWFLREGGSLSSVDQGITEFRVDGYQESAFISMNKQNVVKAELGEGDSAAVVNIEAGKPFAIVLPENIMVTFYDVDGNIVEYRKENI